MSPTFRSLENHNYRIWFAAALVSNIGTWMGRVAQDWVVLTEVTDRSAAALGIVTGLQFLPFLLLFPIAGTIADRYPKRIVLAVTQAVLGLTALALALLVAADAAQLWHVYVIALVSGVATAIDNPTRQAFVSEMVPARGLSNAVALNSASFNLGRLAGPAAAGLTIAAWGSTVALATNALSFIAVLVALAMLDGSALRPAPRPRTRPRVLDGVRYVRRRPDILLVLALVFVLGTFGMNFQITMALMATEEFGKGAGEFGLLGSVMAVGSLSAALLSARRERPRMRVLLLSLAAFVVASALAALAPTYPLFALSLVPVGLSALTAMTTANAMVQLRSDAAVRGRVMALYTAVFFGGTPIGAPVVGWIGEVLGPRWTIGIGSIAVGVALVGAWVWLRMVHDLSVTFDRHRPWITVAVPAPSMPVRRALDPEPVR